MTSYKFLFNINCRFLWNWKLASNQNIFATWDHEPYCNMRSWTILQHEIMNHIATWDHEPYCNMRSWTIFQHEIMNHIATWNHEPYCNMRSWTILQHEIMNHISFFPIMNSIRFNIQSIISNLNISFWQNISHSSFGNILKCY